MLRVLGAVEIDGRGPIRSGAQRTLLSALALDAGSGVSSDRLRELIWAGDEPEHPDASLQNHVSRLRKVLPEDARIEATGSGYRLEAAEGLLDTTAFEGAIRRAADDRGHASAGAIADALSLWRGTPFAELDDDRARAEAVRLEEMRLAAHELRAESLVAEGRLPEAIGELERQWRQAPLRERTVRLLMLAQLDAGRKSDALATFRAHRAAMVEELGLDPSPELRELEVAILTEEVVATPSNEVRPERAPPDDVVSAPPEAGPPVRSRPSIELPTSVLLGREGDLADTVEAVRGHRVVTLVGPGGVGKTRLAFHAAAELENDDDDQDAVVVELASLDHGDQIADAVASALGLPPRSGMSAREQITDAAADRRVLVVLDCCEYLIGAAADFVERLVRGTRGVRVLATSREPLNIDDEHVLRVRPLDPDGAAARLFVDRATARTPLALDERSMSVIERICASLDGIPLAIELAAAKCASMTLDELVDGLDERFVLIAGGRRTAPERHRSLRALVEWSVRSLGPELESVFVRTSVFAGSFTAAGAAAVTGLGERTAQVALAELIDRSLLVEHIAPGRTSRYRYLETIRAYALEALDGLPDAAEVLERHGTWILELAEEMAAAQATGDDVVTADGVIAGLADLRSVQARFSAAGEADRSLRLCCSLRFLALFRMHAEMFRWIRECADRFTGSDHPLVEEILAAASIGSWQSGDLDAARAYAEAAEDAARAAIEGSDRPVPVGTGRAAHEALADVVQFEGDDPASIEHFTAALAGARAAGDEVRVISNLADLAMVLAHAGERERLAEVVEEADRLVTASGSVVLGSWVAYAEGEAYAEIDAERAASRLGTALELADRSSALFVKGVAGLTLTGLQVRTGDPLAAVPGLVDLMEHWRRGGAWVQQWITLRTVVDLLVRVGDHREAAIVLGAVRAEADPSQPSGADAKRLDAAARAIQAARPDAAELGALGASMGQHEVTDLALAHLRSLAAEVTAI